MSVTVNAFVQTTLLDSVEYHLRYTVAKPREEASRDDILDALAYSIRARLIEGLLKTEERLYQRGAKRLVYLSAEYLIGQSLRNNLFNLGFSRRPK